MDQLHWPCMEPHPLHKTITSIVDVVQLIKAELVLVVSGTTNMYPGYGIVCKNVPIFW